MRVKCWSEVMFEKGINPSWLLCSLSRHTFSIHIIFFEIHRQIKGTP